MIQTQQGQEGKQPKQVTESHRQVCELECFCQGVKLHWLVWLGTGTVGEAGGDSGWVCSKDSGRQVVTVRSHQGLS